MVSRVRCCIRFSTASLRLHAIFGMQARSIPGAPQAAIVPEGYSVTTRTKSNSVPYSKSCKVLTSDWNHLEVLTSKLAQLDERWYDEPKDAGSSPAFATPLSIHTRSSLNSAFYSSKYM